jgi:hypothetical protein
MRSVIGKSARMIGQIQLVSRELKAMKTKIALSAITIILGTAAAVAQQNTDVGKANFEESCAICHGSAGKGDGMVALSLKVKPADLTVLAKNNGGVFPMSRVERVIDGRWHALLPAPLPNASDTFDETGFIATFNEAREMPIWGERLSIAAAEHYFDVPYDQEQYIDTHIKLLADYVYRIQER